MACLSRICRTADSYFGTDFYEIHFITSASTEAVLSYYSGIITQRDNTVLPDTLFGKVSGHPASVSINTLADSSVEVTLTLGMDKSTEDQQGKPAGQSSGAKAEQSNPYFSNFQLGVEVLGGKKNTLYSMSYEKNNDTSRNEQYFIRYKSTLEQLDFALMYETKYGSMQDFTHSDTDYSQSLSFLDNGCLFTIYLTKPQKSGDNVYLTIVCERPASVS